MLSTPGVNHRTPGGAPIVRPENRARRVETEEYYVYSNQHHVY